MSLSAAPAALYTQTGLSLDQVNSQSIVELRVPERLSTQTSPHQRFVSEIGRDEGEDAFNSRHIGTDGAIYFRPSYPRVILWRLLDSRRVLELRSVDLSNSTTAEEDDNECVLTIRLRFADELLPHCISFAEVPGKDRIAITVVTDSGRLYLLAVPVEFLVYAQASDIGVEKWAQVYQPPAFTLKKPYRIAVFSADRIAVSMTDGSLLLLTRESFSERAEGWKETFLTQTSRSLFSFLPWKLGDSVLLDDVKVNPSCATSMAPSPDGQHLFTVSLERTMHCWRVADGRQIFSIDLASSADETAAPGFGMLNSLSVRPLLELVQSDSPGRYTIVTYHPPSRQLRFWRISNPDQGVGGYQPICEGSDFVIPLDVLINKSNATLEQFTVDGSARLGRLNLWIRVRSGSLSRVFTIALDLTADQRTIANAWNRDWVGVDSGSHSTDRLKSVSAIERTASASELHRLSSTEEWIDFLFYPGRFSVPSLECALKTYSDLQPAEIRAGSAVGTALKDRIRTVIETVVSTGPDSRSRHGLTADKCAMLLLNEWKCFFAIVRDQHESRTEMVSFAFDPVDRLGWVVHADMVSPIRQYSPIELVASNGASEDRGETAVFPFEQVDPQAKAGLILVGMAKRVRETLMDGYRLPFVRAVRAYVSIDATVVPSDQIVRFGTESGLPTFTTADTDVLFFSAIEALESENRTLESQLFYDILEKINPVSQGDDSPSSLTWFGSKMLLQGSRDMAACHLDLLFDLLVLIIIAHERLEGDPAAGALDTAALFLELVSHLREQLIVDWLLRTVLPVEKPDSAESPPSSPDGAAMPSDELVKHTTTSVMEVMFIGDWAQLSTVAGVPTSEKITLLCSAWLGRLSLPQEFDLITSNIGFFLIGLSDISKALEFFSYLPKTPWSTYLQAKAMGLAEQYDGAAYRFNRAATYLSSPGFQSELDNLGFLTDEPGAERAFCSGLDRYYRHVAAFFTSIHAHSHALSFYQAAVDAYSTVALGANHKMIDRLIMFSSGQSPHTLPMDSTPELVESAGLMDELLARVCESALWLDDFDSAYSALIKMSDGKQMGIHLEQFLIGLVTRADPTRLTDYPFTYWQVSLVESTLERLCDRTVKPDGTTGLLPTPTMLDPLSPAGRYPYHHVLYSWRIFHNDFAGAGSIVYDLLVELIHERDFPHQSSIAGLTGYSASDLYYVQSDAIADCYLMLINALSCCPADQSQIVVGKSPDFVSLAKEADIMADRHGHESEAEPEGQDSRRPSRPFDRDRRRTVISLKDIRAQYNVELDKTSKLERGEFAFGA